MRYETKPAKDSQAKKERNTKRHGKGTPRHESFKDMQNFYRRYEEWKALNGKG